ncbi:hypothetical protein WAI453_013415 [Rhynchosporium graminicola]
MDAPILGQSSIATLYSPLTSIFRAMATTNASRVSDDLLSSLRSAVYDINIQLYSSIDRSSSSSTDQALLPTLAKLQDNFNSLSSLVSSTPQIQ